MPTDQSGHYTPLSALKQRVAETYLGRILRAGRRPDQDAIDKALKKVGGDASDTSQVVSAMLAADGANRTAAVMRRTHNRTPTAAEHAAILGESSRRGQYAYTVLVSATNPNTGITSHAQVVMYSPSPMSLQTVRYNVDANRDYFIRQTGSPKVTDSDTSGYQLSTMILSAGVIR